MSLCQMPPLCASTASPDVLYEVYGTTASCFFSFLANLNPFRLACYFVAKYSITKRFVAVCGVPGLAWARSGPRLLQCCNEFLLRSWYLVLVLLPRYSIIVSRDPDLIVILFCNYLQLPDTHSAPMDSDMLKEALLLSIHTP